MDETEKNKKGKNAEEKSLKYVFLGSFKNKKKQSRFIEEFYTR